MSIDVTTVTGGNMGARRHRQHPLRRLCLVLLLAALSVACATLGSGEDDASLPDRFTVRILNDNFLNVRVDLVYRTGTRIHLGTVLSYVETRLQPAADVLLQDEFFVELDLVGGSTYRVPDPVDFPPDAAALEVFVRPVLEQSYVSIR